MTATTTPSGVSDPEAQSDRIARERTSTRLLAASARHSFDPRTEIDWDEPPVPGLPYRPLHRVTLFGTPTWEAMSEQQRLDLSRHELASLSAAGIWLEFVLMQMLLRQAYDGDPRSTHVQYALTEVADECRHSEMFARLLNTMDCPAYGPRFVGRQLGRVFKTLATGPEVFAAALIAEEILDQLQREAMADESVQPLARAICRVHVVEEARHIGYASDELPRQWKRLGPAGRSVVRLSVATTAAVTTSVLIHPDVYAAVGLDPAQAVREARNNVHHQRSMRWASRRLVARFEELGLLHGPGRRLWSRAGLL